MEIKSSELRNVSMNQRFNVQLLFGTTACYGDAASGCSPPARFSVDRLPLVASNSIHLMATRPLIATQQFAELRFQVGSAQVPAYNDAFGIHQEVLWNALNPVF